MSRFRGTITINSFKEDGENGKIQCSFLEEAAINAIKEDILIMEGDHSFYERGLKNM